MTPMATAETISSASESVMETPPNAKSRMSSGSISRNSSAMRPVASPYSTMVRSVSQCGTPQIVTGGRFGALVARRAIVLRERQMSITAGTLRPRTTPTTISAATPCDTGSTFPNASGAA